MVWALLFIMIAYILENYGVYMSYKWNQFVSSKLYTICFSVESIMLISYDCPMNLFLFPSFTPSKQTMLITN